MRSLLLVPGDARSKLDEAFGCGADALIVDLADPVPLSAKGEARRTAAAFVRDATARAPRPLVFVRVNAYETGLTDADLAAVMPVVPDGIVLPEAEGGHDVQRLAAKLAVAEAEHGIPGGRSRILPIAAETAKGVLAIGTIPGSSPRLVGLASGGEDLSADLGAEANRDGDGRYTAPTLLARAMTLLAAAAAEVDAVDAAFTACHDLDGLARACRDARRDGFAAKMALHPAQVPVINDAFGPAPATIEEAREIVALFAADPGAVVAGHRGRTIDRPRLRRAERILARLDTEYRPSWTRHTPAADPETSPGRVGGAPDGAAARDDDRYAMPPPPHL